MIMLGHDGDKSEDANLKGKHLESEALFVVRLSPRHLPVDQPDGNVLVDLPIIWVITIICIYQTYTIYIHIYLLCHQQQSIISDLVQCDDDDQVEGGCGD